LVILAIKILCIWSLVAFLIGLALGATIRKGERIHKDEFLACLFSTIEAMQAPRKLNPWGA